MPDSSTDSQKRRLAHRLGLRGEWLAGVWLWCKGYRILARRLRTPLGEIDLLARHRFWRRDELVAVEVRVRRTREEAEFSLDFRKRRRLHTAGVWLQSCGMMAESDSLRWDYIVWAPWHWPKHVRGVEL